MANAIAEREEIVFCESATRTISVVGWTHDDGDAIASIRFRDSQSTINKTLSVSEATALVRGLQRWLSSLANRAASND